MNSPPMTTRRNTSGLGGLYRRLDAKHLVVFLNTLILVVAEWRFGGLGGYDRLLMALGACIATEVGLSLLILGRLPRSYVSPYISGVSLSLLLKPAHGILWPFALGGFLSVASKYVLRDKHSHLWNPTNFVSLPSEVAMKLWTVLGDTDNIDNVEIGRASCRERV